MKFATVLAAFATAAVAAPAGTSEATPEPTPTPNSDAVDQLLRLYGDSLPLGPVINAVADVRKEGMEKGTTSDGPVATPNAAAAQ